MSIADKIRNNIIDELLTISNTEYLSALYQLVSNSTKSGEPNYLSEAQMAILNLSEEDIENNRLVPQKEVDKNDLEWLKRL